MNMLGLLGYYAFSQRDVVKKKAIKHIKENIPRANMQGYLPEPTSLPESVKSIIEIDSFYTKTSRGSVIRVISQNKIKTFMDILEECNENDLDKKNDFKLYIVAINKIDFTIFQKFIDMKDLYLSDSNRIDFQNLRHIISKLKKVHHRAGYR